MSAEFLKEVFGDRALTYDELSQALSGNEKIKLANLADGEYVSKHKYAADLQAEQNKLKDYDPEWKTKLADAQTKAQAELDSYKLNAALNEALKAAKARDNKSVIANLDTQRLSLDESGKLTGIDEQLTALKENKPFLFEAAEVKQNLGAKTNGVSSAMGGLKGALNDYFSNK